MISDLVVVRGDQPRLVLQLTARSIFSVS